MKIFAIGRNYAKHAKELNNPVPDDPVVFMKPPTAVLAGGRPFYYPDFSENIHFEAELVYKLNNHGKNIQEKFARKYYDEVTLGLDLTARDIQQKCKEKGLPWELAKGFDGSAVLGAFIPLESLPDRHNIHFQLKKNKATVQEGSNTDMIFNIDRLIAFLSRFFTLQKGDLIFTGTPEGVGPIAINDHFEGAIEGREILTCPIK